MADSKVTTMQAATEISSADVLYLIKPSTSPYDFKVTIANLFGGIPVPATFEKPVNLSGTIQTLTGGSGAAIDITKTVTKVVNPDGSGVLTITAGTEGQIKIIVMTSNPAGHALALTGDMGVPIQFTATGHTATLMCVSNKWWFIGGTASLVD